MLAAARLSIYKEIIMGDNDRQNETPMFKRIVALVGVLLLIGVYVVFLIQALFGKTGPGSAFLACAAATVAIPIAIWLILWVYSSLTGKRTVASSDPYGRFDTQDSDGGNSLAEGDDQNGQNADNTND